MAAWVTVGTALLLIGALTVQTVQHSVRRIRRLAWIRRSGEHVTGRCDRVRRQGGAAFLVCSFTVPSGDRVVIEIPSVRDPAFREGDPVPIVYAPGAPHHAEAETYLGARSRQLRLECVAAALGVPLFAAVAVTATLWGNR